MKNPIEHIRMSIVKTYPAQIMKYVRYRVFRLQSVTPCVFSESSPTVYPVTMLKFEKLHAENFSSN